MSEVFTIYRALKDLSSIKISVFYIVPLGHRNSLKNGFLIRIEIFGIGSLLKYGSIWELIFRSRKYFLWLQPIKKLVWDHQKRLAPEVIFEIFDEVDIHQRAKSNRAKPVWYGSLFLSDSKGKVKITTQCILIFHIILTIDWNEWKIFFLNSTSYLIKTKHTYKCKKYL
jgi:hypothetical protein